jgi:KUP system potassium uptake protein
VILLTVVIEDFPRVPARERLEVSDYGLGIYQMIVHFGFMDDPNVPDALWWSHGKGPDVDVDTVTYYVGGQNLIPTEECPVMATWREKLFAYLARNAAWPANFYGLPPDQVIELGIEVKL